ncbi:collagen alpha-1(I) chain-like [Petaurus breviceps papuanus]|uniref:collagen alpha-1(I) chain-like n=1 Tax=Petaurus breviceps papuanus TaxID=3040969 RepID=UPI0036D94756
MRRPVARAGVDWAGRGRRAEPLPRGPLLAGGRGLEGGARDPLAGARDGGRSPSAGWAAAGPRARGGGAQSRPLGSVVVVSRCRGSSGGRVWGGWRAEPRPLGSVFVVGRDVGLSPPPRRREGRAPPPEPGALRSRGAAQPRNASDNEPWKPAPQPVNPGLGARPGPQPWRHVPGVAPGPRGEGWGPAKRSGGAGVKGRPNAPGDRQWREAPAPLPQRGDGWGTGERPTSSFLVPRSRPASFPGRHPRDRGAALLGLGGGPRAGPPCLSSSLAGRPSTAPSARQWPRGAAPLPGDGSGCKAGPASFGSLLAGRPSTSPLDRPSCSWEGRVASSGTSWMRGAEPSSLASFSFGRNSPSPSAHSRWESGARRAEPPSCQPFPGSFSAGPPAPHWWKGETPPLSRKARPPSPRFSWAGRPKSSPSWPRSDSNFPRTTSPPGLRRGGREETRPNFRSEVAWGRGPGELLAQQCWLRGCPSRPQSRRTTQAVPQPTQFCHQGKQGTQMRSSASFDPYWMGSPARDPPPAAGWKTESRSLESLLTGKRNSAPFPPYWLEEGVPCTYPGVSWKPKPHSPDPLLFGKRGSVPTSPYWAEGVATGRQLGDPCKPSDRPMDFLLFGNRSSAPSAPYWPEAGTSPIGDRWRSQPHRLDFELFGKTRPAPSGPYWMEGGATSSPLRNGWKAGPRPLDFGRFDKQGRGSNSPYWLEGGARDPRL